MECAYGVRLKPEDPLTVWLHHGTLDNDPPKQSMLSALTESERVLKVQKRIPKRAKMVYKIVPKMKRKRTWKSPANH